jgi:hypothetical protein
VVGNGATEGGFCEAISAVNPEGVGAGGNFEKGLVGGNSGFGAVEGVIEENGLEGFDSAAVVILNVVAGVVVIEEVGLFAKGFDEGPFVDPPNENAGSCEEGKVGALIELNNPLPPVVVALVADCGIPVDPPLMPFYKTINRNASPREENVHFVEWGHQCWQIYFVLALLIYITSIPVHTEYK